MVSAGRGTNFPKAGRLDSLLFYLGKKMLCSFFLCALEVCAMSKKHLCVGGGGREGGRERNRERERGGGGGGRKGMR